ncbi:MAG: phosphoenolpyruvate carboxykinase [Elusimicrobia bacterium]|nr:phosphoenolpyruvate carboxykinase [Elusimicrobiota bacterium]
MITLEPSLKILNNPGDKELRRLAQADEMKTSYGAPAYITKKAASRSAKDTRLVADGLLGRGQQPADAGQIKALEQALPKILSSLELIQVDRVIGRNSKKEWHCRLLIPKFYARIALLWSGTLFEASGDQKDPAAKPDFLTIDLPDWPEGHANLNGLAGIGPRGVFVRADEGRTYILGTDYVGEVKMSFLRQAMYQMKKLGGLGLHAGSKVIRVNSGDGHKDIGVLLFGLSGTGKTTLTLEDHGLKAPEGITLLQDDIVWLTHGGDALGTEDNFYVKTEGVTNVNQPGIYQALFDPQTVFENVYVNPATGNPEFENYSLGTNGRALAIRGKIHGSGPDINLAKVHKIFFITRRDTVVPPVARLSHEQAAGYFMLGESIETSAGDPSRAGQPKHEVGFNPFIIGPEQDEGRRLLEMLKTTGIECYLLNTGSIGKEGDIKGGTAKKITQAVSAKIIEAVVRGAISWKRDPFWGYEVAAVVPGVSHWDDEYNPERYYSSGLYSALNRELLRERRAFLAQYQFDLPIA